MTTDLDKRLAELRLAPHWTADERAVILDHVISTDPEPQRADRRLVAAHARPSRRTAVFATAGLAAAACIAVPAVLPAGAPGSADQAAAVQALRHLARVAAVSPADDLGPNQYLHLVDVGHQNSSPGQAASDYRYEYWIRADGLTYQRRMDNDEAGSRAENWLTPPGPQFVDGLTAPVYLDQLPTEPGALESYVREHSTGSTSADEQVYVAVADIVRRGLAGPRLRSAAIEILARLGHVQLGAETHDALGNPVQAFDFVDPEGRPGEVETVMFDTRTAQVTEDRDYLDQKLFAQTTVPVFEVVDSVPASVREHAVVQK